MTEKQMRFCQEYLIDCNGVRAYKAAFPHIKNDHSARTLASRLLAKVDIRTYIDEQLQKMSDAKIADVKEVMEYLTSVLRNESESEIVVVEGVGEGCSVAKRISKAPDEKEKLKAAELLGKRFGMFKDGLAVSLEPVSLVDDLKE